jgi:hypothetical protein
MQKHELHEVEKTVYELRLENEKLKERKKVIE